MAVIRNSGELVSYIGSLIPDNNAGQISAADVRNSIVDTVVSINSIVGSGDFDATTPFVKNVRIKATDGDNSTGHLIVGSGIIFPNYPTNVQYMPYPGPTAINHNQLTNLDTGDPHTQYIHVTGIRPLKGNIGLDTHWINSSGTSNIEASTGRGLQFSYVSSSKENVNVGSGTQFVFLNDKSTLSSARGAAKAWINFDATSGVVAGKSLYVLDSYNVSGIKKEESGKFTIIFHSGVFKDNNYVAVGTSNATSSSGNFQTNTVGLIYRSSRSDGTRSLSFQVMDDGGQFCDAKINDLVVYGTEPIGSGQPNITIL